MDTLILIPQELYVAPAVQRESQDEGFAVYSRVFLKKGVRFLPLQGSAQIGAVKLEGFLQENDIRLKLGCVDVIQEIEPHRQVRQCNWVRFLSHRLVSDASTSCGCNVAVEAVDGDVVFVLTQDVAPNTRLVMAVNSRRARDEVQVAPNTRLVMAAPNTRRARDEVQVAPNTRLVMAAPDSRRAVDEEESSTGSEDQMLDMSDNELEHCQETPLDLSKTPTPRATSTPLRRLSHRAVLPCGVCGKTFDRPSLLKRHTRTHTGEKPHVCEVCSKGFSTSSSLNTHKRIHTGEKPHECQTCGKRFTASSNLYYHRMTHTKEKPHKCVECGKSFPTPGDLKAHMYIHSGTWPYRCGVCNRGFSKQTNLRNHAFLHTGDRPHPCPLCGKKFALACNLRAHTKTHHTDHVVSQSKPSEPVRHRTDPPRPDLLCVARPSEDFWMSESFFLPHRPTPYLTSMSLVELQTMLLVQANMADMFKHQHEKFKH